MKTFKGPGHYLLCSLGRVTHPECEHHSFDFSENNPPCKCVYTHLSVPYGWNYSHEGDHACLHGPKIYEKEGVTYYWKGPSE